MLVMLFRTLAAYRRKSYPVSGKQQKSTLYDDKHLQFAIYKSQNRETKSLKE